MKLLVLAGTAEARALCARLAGDERFDVLASLAGATRSPAPYEVQVRRGGFGGLQGQEHFIDDNGFRAVIDATHPFARTIPQRTQAICARHGVPYLRLVRPGWRPGPGDRWTFVEGAAEVAKAVAPGARVFLATGGRSLKEFCGLSKGFHVISRVVDPPSGPHPFANGEWIVGRPPFSAEDEEETFRALGIDVLVAKDAGGPSAGKLVAARRLGLPVVLVRRPEPPPGARVETVAAALAWLERLA